MKRTLVLVASMFCLQSYAQTIPNIEMVLVKGGSITMGCTAEQGSDCDDDEKPAHKVTLSDFYIGKYEVTQAQWKAVMGSNPSHFSGCENCPVEQISWNDVQEFIKKLNAKTGLNYRLPTEAEWEYAARGGAKSLGYKYSGSNSVDEVAWYDGNSGNKTHAVGTKQANELGIYDMSGNVWEWCNDWYGNYSSEAQSNPKGPSSASLRVFRGGCWNYSAQFVRVSDRSRSTPDYRYDFLGFRLVRDVK
jgi:formylglycine-generating enzyme required for sulfatase activity